MLSLESTRYMYAWLCVDVTPLILETHAKSGAGHIAGTDLVQWPQGRVGDGTESSGSGP